MGRLEWEQCRVTDNGPSDDRARDEVVDIDSDHAGGRDASRDESAKSRARARVLQKRQQRLATELRSNLKRRKDKSRAGTVPDADDGPT